ncbi:MAG TPA: alpha/beta fold hydrolase [Actinomycetospora sp.]|uniref:alpha/beta fold hydrolase n=1 Tax=Actinomycetospora sp. TaxID=1872135 RepID=UPI002F4151F8
MTADMAVSGLGVLDTGGAGSPVVLLHSLGADHRMWRPQIDALACRHRVLAPDTRGHGVSRNSRSTLEPTIDGWVEDLVRVLDGAEVERAVLVGVSLGGIQAVATAAAHPDRVTALVVADSFVELQPATAEAKIAGLVDTAGREGMAAVAEQYVAETVLRRPAPRAADDLRDAIAGMDPDDYAGAVTTCFRVRLADRLAAVHAPTLVVWGALDRKTPRALSERIAAGIDGARLTDLPGAGHLSNVDEPDAFTAVVAGFLDSLTTATSSDERR